MRKAMVCIWTLAALLLWSTALSFGMEDRSKTSGAREGEISGEISDEQRREIQAGLDESIARLQAVGKLPAMGARDKVLLSWPVRTAAPGAGDAYYLISGYPDDGSPDLDMTDFHCGTRTYQGHQGTDIVPYPFPWYAMDTNQMEVIAAAKGTIIMKDDSHDDRDCDGDRGKTGNAIYLRHDDGTVAWYYHVKKNSLTAKAVGEKVEEGEFLGYPGSSGISTVPHLHFELHDGSGQFIDPWAGMCNKKNSESRWKSQRNYSNPEFFKIMSGSAMFTELSCGTWGTMSGNDFYVEKNDFLTRENIYFTTFFRDLSPGQQIDFTVYTPDGSVHSQWALKDSDVSPDYGSGYSFTNTLYLPQDAPPGLWNLAMSFNGVVHEHGFTVRTNPDNSNANDPRPTIKANGTAKILDITSSDTLTVTVSLDPGNGAGEEADWLISAVTSLGTYSYDLAQGWIPGDHTTYIAKLTTLPLTVLFTAKGLPSGYYLFIFKIIQKATGKTSLDSVYVQVKQ